MAKRYRYAFAKRKEAEEGILAIVLAGVSVLLLVADLVLYGMSQGEGLAYAVIGGVSVCGTLLSFYGFVQGMRGLMRADVSHTCSMTGAIADALILMGWLGIFFTGL